MVIGALCAIDHEPRVWSEEDVTTLPCLARRAIDRIADRARAGGDAQSGA